MKLLTLILGIVSALFAGDLAYSCGLPWIPPRSHFDDVDFQGHPHLVERVGFLPIADDAPALPIYLIFNPSYGNSPCAGAFSIPLLESKFVQVDERRFLLRSPSGWLLPFLRSNEGTVLSGAMGMKAEILGDTISVWSDCGEKLVFRNGRLAHFKNHYGELNFVYSGSSVHQIKNGEGTVVLQVEPRSDGPGIASLKLTSGKSVNFVWGKRPLVQEIAGTRVVGEVRDTVVQLQSADNIVESFEFATDADVRPNLTVNKGRALTWNPLTLKIEKDGDWSYTTEGHGDQFSFSSIRRLNTITGKSESWLFEGSRAQETTEDGSGRKRVKSWFTSGKLAGKLRSIIEVQLDGTTVDHYRAAYDEQGHLLRETRTHGVSREASLDDLAWENSLVSDQSTKLSTTLDYHAAGGYTENVQSSSGYSFRRTFDSKKALRTVEMEGKTLVFDYDKKGNRILISSQPKE